MSVFYDGSGRMRERRPEEKLVYKLRIRARAAFRSTNYRLSASARSLTLALVLCGVLLLLAQELSRATRNLPAPIPRKESKPEDVPFIDDAPSIVPPEPEEKPARRKRRAIK